MQVLLGSGKYSDLAQVDNIAAPVFYYPFIFIMVFVVFNMTIAIIMDGYALSQDERKSMKSSYLKELNQIKFFHQVFWGLIRQLRIVRCFLPRFLRYRTMEDGTRVDRFTEPGKNEVVALLEPVESFQERFITVAEYLDLLARANMTIGETQLEQIVEKHVCWEDFDEPVYKAERIEQRKMEEAETLDKTVTVLQERIATIVATQQQMGAKVDAILRSFIVRKTFLCFYTVSSHLLPQHLSLETCAAANTDIMLDTFFIRDSLLTTITLLAYA